MKLHEIKTDFPLKFDAFGDPIISDYQKERIKQKNERKPDPRRWFKFKCQDCGHVWKARARPDRMKYCQECNSGCVTRTLLGNKSENKAQQGRSNVEIHKPPISQISIHLNSRRMELIEAYNRIPHRVDLRVDAQ